MHLAGVPEPDFYAPIFSTSLARIQWLGVTLINTILASMVISQFKSTLEKKGCPGRLDAYCSLHGRKFWHASSHCHRQGPSNSGIRHD